MNAISFPRFLRKETLMRCIFPSLPALLLVALLPALGVAAHPLKVVTTLPDYADLTRQIAGPRAEVFALVKGNQDAHFIRPKPSFVRRVRAADLLITTGLDLELWLPTIINRSGNTKVRSGQPGFVAASADMRMLQIPTLVSRSEGGLHVYGNPHVTCSPINMRVAARNIANGLIKVDPSGKKVYAKRLKKLQVKFDQHLFGTKLVEMLGGDLLCRLAEQGKLLPFLEKQVHGGVPLLSHLGGWMKQMLPLRGKGVVTYHKNWAYFLQLFSLELDGTVEPKPGVPPTARHRSDLLKSMRSERIQVVLAANYFNQNLAQSIAQQAHATAVIVPLYVGGAPSTETYFKLVDHWIEALKVGFERAHNE
jgi:ABC-type Zn uptake system ZnuABC Zn-binding protein ZnuA